MSHNSFGHLFRVTTWGESHGPAIGCVVDGCPPRLPLTEADIQPWLDKRRPGQSKFTTQRQEPDQVRILSGVFEGLTTGTPISLVIENQDQRSRDYAAISTQFRPGHADLTYDLKYGIRDYRGGGRSSARETAMRVAAGAVARKVLGAGGRHPRRTGADRRRTGSTAPAGTGIRSMRTRSSAPTPWRRRPGKPIWRRCASPASSAGAVIEVMAEGVPPGLGAPIYGKLDADHRRRADVDQRRQGRGDRRRFCHRRAVRRGERRRDADAGRAGEFGSNHAGGILGGISTGQPIVARFAVKPTSSILSPRQSVDRSRP